MTIHAVYSRGHNVPDGAPWHLHGCALDTKPAQEIRELVARIHPGRDTAVLVFGDSIYCVDRLLPERFPSTFSVYGPRKDQP